MASGVVFWVLAFEVVFFSLKQKRFFILKAFNKTSSSAFDNIKLKMETKNVHLGRICQRQVASFCLWQIMENQQFLFILRFNWWVMVTDCNIKLLLKIIFLLCFMLILYYDIITCIFANICHIPTQNSHHVHVNDLYPVYTWSRL